VDQHGFVPLRSQVPIRARQGGTPKQAAHVRSVVASTGGGGDWSDGAAVHVTANGYARRVILEPLARGADAASAVDMAGAAVAATSAISAAAPPEISAAAVGHAQPAAAAASGRPAASASGSAPAAALEDEPVAAHRVAHGWLALVAELATRLIARIAPRIIARLTARLAPRVAPPNAPPLPAAALC